jgi:hypothetical protein
MDDLIHKLQRIRVIPFTVTGFIIWLTYDFHEFYKAHAMQMNEWQIAAVFAYAGTLVATIKFLFEHITDKIERDE